MSTRQHRGATALATVALALWSGVAAEAQMLVIPTRGGTKHQSNPWINGAQNEIVNRHLAEHRMETLQARRQSDAARGDWDAVARADQKMGYLRYRIAVDDWLIGKLMYQCNGYYPPVIDEMSLEYIGQAACPGPPPPLPQPMAPDVPMNTAPTIAVTILNVEAAGASVSYGIDGLTHQAAPASRQRLTVTTGTSIRFDAGGSIGPREYRLTPGTYEFRSSAEGWTFFKVGGSP